MRLPEIVQDTGITQLNPVQKKALETRFIENSANLVVSSPTGSGKTLIAELAALECVRKGKKVVYTCPLRALASEHYQTFKKYEKMGLKIALSIGDYDSSDRWLERYDIIVTSYEKLDSLMRHKATFIPFVGLLIADEIHLIDSDRGAILETIISRFKHLFPHVQIIGLSATIPNVDEIAKWLGAESVESNWRPTKLIKGVYFDGIIETTEGTIEIKAEEKTPTMQICDYELSNGHNALVFVNTRKGAEAEAERLRRITRAYINKDELNELAEDIEHALEIPTKQCKRLAACFRDGVAFHHAGLVKKQRDIVEQAFKSNKIRVIVATPTLALGVNLPADTVVIRDMTRYGVNGIVNIPVREYIQMAGRAGRPTYSKEGLAVIIAKDLSEKQSYWETYINGIPEKVYSQLGFEPVLRMQTLASIAIGFTPTKQKLEEFFMNTFYAFQHGELDTIMRQAQSIINDLIDMGFVLISGSKLIATEIGRRVSELYIDPLSAYRMMDAMKNRTMGTLGIIYMLVDTEEMKPYLSARRKEEVDLWRSAYLHEKEIGIDVASIGYEHYNFIDKYKTTLLFND